MARVRNLIGSSEKKKQARPLNSSSSRGWESLHKKDITLEEQTIGGFTLIFQDPNTENKWQSAHLIRQIRLTQRLLFCSALFQGLFFCSDMIDGQADHYLLLIGSTRLLITILFILGSFLVGTGLLLPNQLYLCFAKIIYGGPTLAIYCLTRARASQWDFLFLVYGLCFFGLPKISPLNFIYAFYGTGIYTFLFIYFSAFRLTLAEWMLSSTYLLIIVLLFMYISYSSERSARERWLLRERLHREHIDIKMVACSIEEDLSKAVEARGERYSSLQGSHSSTNRRSQSQSNDEPVNTPASRPEKSMVLFFKGLAAWGLVMVMGYAFDSFTMSVEESGVANGQDSIPPTRREMVNSAPFALLLHSTGFSIFLLYFTGQVRWFILNGLVGLGMIWVFHQSGMNNRWIVFSTHSVGYILLAAVVVIMILVFGGVVLVWTHLIDFLKDILVRYPQVKNNLREEKVLEQVLIRYLSDMPSPSLIHPTVPAFTSANGDEESGLPLTNFSSKEAPVRVEHQAHSSPIESKKDIPLSRVISAKRDNCCYFCLRENPKFLLPVCDGWTPTTLSEECGDNAEGIPMCTPYTQLVSMKDKLLVTVQDRNEAIQGLKKLTDELQSKLKSAESDIISLQSTLQNLQSQAVTKEKEHALLLMQERQRRNDDIQRIIGQHNTQLAELKRLHKLSLAAARKQATSRKSVEVSASFTEVHNAECSPAAVAVEKDSSQMKQKVVDTKCSVKASSSSPDRNISNFKERGQAQPTSKRQNAGGGHCRTPNVSLVDDDRHRESVPSSQSTTSESTERTDPPISMTTPEDDDFNRFFLTSMNDIEALLKSLSTEEFAVSTSAGISTDALLQATSASKNQDLATSTTSRMKYAVDIENKSL